MGNYEPRPFHVSVLGDGYYLVREHTGKQIRISPPAESQDVYDWMLNMDDTELEAALQIYSDRWTFQSGKDRDKVTLEALEVERERRKKPNPSFAPGIFR